MRLEGAEGIALLRARLDEMDFRPEAIQRLAGSQESLLRARGDREVQLRRLPAGVPLATAAKLFLLGVAVPAEEARSALAPIPLDRLERMGLLEVGGTASAPACGSSRTRDSSSPATGTTSSSPPTLVPTSSATSTRPRSRSPR